MRRAFVIALAAAITACQLVGGIDEKTLRAGNPADAGSDDAPAGDGFSVPHVCSEGNCLHTIATGFAFTCSREDDGRVRCWGANEKGQLADDSQDDRKDPIYVAGIDGATDIWAGREFVCARHFDTTVSCWGSNVSRELGAPDVHTYFRARPVPVVGLTGVRELALGHEHACARTADGVSCWGADYTGQTGQPIPSKLEEEWWTSPPAAVPGLGADVIQIAAGGETSCAVRADGSLWCWGSNDSGQLANGTRKKSIAPVAVEALGPVARVALSEDRACALLRDGTVWCWGGSEAKDADGGPPPVPVPIDGVEHAVDIALGETVRCARIDDGSVVCWGGEGGHGEIGRGSRNGGGPGPVLGLANVVAFDVGGSHTCARTNDGVLYSWGANASGQLGDGSTTDQYEPVKVLAP